MRAKSRNQHTRVLILQLYYTTHTPTIKQLHVFPFTFRSPHFPRHERKIKRSILAYNNNKNSYYIDDNIIQYVVK